MDRLTLRQPLADKTPIVRRGFRAQVIPHQSLAELRADPVSLPQQLRHLLPLSANRSIDHRCWRVAWLRPDGWLLIDTPQDTERHASFPVFAGAKAARITDLSHALVGIAAAGYAMPRVIGQGTPLDLRPTKFGPGQCTRTWCAGFSILLDHTDTHVSIYVEASWSTAFWEWLTDASYTLPQ